MTEPLDLPELDYTSPLKDRFPDRFMDETEARLWLISQRDRTAGHQVKYVPEVERWAVDGEFVMTVDGEWIGLTGKRAVLESEVRATCTGCGRSFAAKRKTALWCGATCRTRARRAA